MTCPKCSGETRTVDSRPAGDRIRRRRVCQGCGHRFTTFEYLHGEPATGLAIADPDVAQKILTAVTKAAKPKGRTVSVTWMMRELEAAGRDRALTDFESRLLEKCIALSG